MSEQETHPFNQWAGENTMLGMPPKVANAIVAVMGEVPKLQKGERNTHGSYNFAGIDDFLEAVRPLCAKHGLVIMQDEADFQTKEGVSRDKQGREKETLWLIIRYEFTLAHSSGETWAHKPKRTIMVNGSMGSQAFGAAQSYALKQFMRAAFQIATGEAGQDVDAHAPEQIPTPEWKGPLGKHALKRKLTDLANDLNACTDSDTLAGIMQAYKDELSQARDEPQMNSEDSDHDWYGRAMNAITRKQQQLQAAEASGEQTIIGAG